jgi:hypothetical protein
MQLLHAGVDTSVIALWLGHESVQSTQVYLHADATIKQPALDRATPANTVSGHYHAPDSLLAFLNALQLCRPRPGQHPRWPGQTPALIHPRGIIHRSA